MRIKSLRPGRPIQQPRTRQLRHDKASEKIKALLEARRRATKRSKLPRPPHPASIKPLQRRYFMLLKPMTDAMAAKVKSGVLPHIADILAMAERARPTVDGARHDTYGEEISSIVQLAKARLLREYSEEKLEEMARKMAKATNDFSINNMNKFFQKVFGTDYARFEPWMAQEMDGFVKINVTLIKSIPETHFTNIETTVLRGAQSGRLARDIAADIQAQAGVSERKAAFIARDQVAKFNGDLNWRRQTEAGITKYEWSTSGDERVREEHAALDGKTFSWDDPPAEGHPGQSINCRCTALPVIEFEGLDLSER